VGKSSTFIRSAKKYTDIKQEGKKGGYYEKRKNSMPL
jgi:hypothetical protein